MKKQLLIMIITILCCALCGCGQDEQSQFDKGTNQSVSFQGINFQIPKEWKRPDVKFDDSYLAFAEWQEENKLPTRFLGIIFESGIDLTEALKDRKDAIEIGEKEGTYLRDYKQTMETIETMDVASVVYNRDIKGQTFEYRELLLETDEGVIIMQFSSTDFAGIEDFEKVVNSITKNK